MNGQNGKSLTQQVKTKTACKAKEAQAQGKAPRAAPILITFQPEQGARTEMKARLKGKLTYANVLSTLCMFVLLGGSAYAALSVPRNSVGTRQLQAKAVTNGKLANGSVTGAKIAEATITGQNINMAALGTVPPQRALQTQPKPRQLDKHEASCPQGTTLIRGVCFDSHSNPPIEGVEAAAERCAGKGRLPADPA